VTVVTVATVVVGATVGRVLGGAALVVLAAVAAGSMVAGSAVSALDVGAGVASPPFDAHATSQTAHSPTASRRTRRGDRCGVTVASSRASPAFWSRIFSKLERIRDQNADDAGKYRAQRGRTRRRGSGCIRGSTRSSTPIGRRS
jgi:hypothetical protein